MRFERGVATAPLEVADIQRLETDDDIDAEIERLKKSLLSLCALVEEDLAMAVKTVLHRDEALAERVEASDGEINEAEVDVEEECLKILALHQPVAVDLRFVVSTLKINNDLERIGDHTTHVAEMIYYVEKGEPLGDDRPKGDPSGTETS